MGKRRANLSIHQRSLSYALCANLAIELAISSQRFRDFELVQGFFLVGENVALDLMANPWYQWDDLNFEERGLSRASHSKCTRTTLETASSLQFHIVHSPCK